MGLKYSIWYLLILPLPFSRLFLKIITEKGIVMNMTRSKMFVNNFSGSSFETFSF